MVNGIRFEGTKGAVFCDREKCLATNPDHLLGDIPDIIRREAHKANFIDMLTKNARPVATAEIGHRSATVCHLVYAAVRLNAHLKWNPVTERIEGENATLANRALELPRNTHWYNI